MENLTNSIKNAFLKVKEDIEFLNNEVLNLKVTITELKDLINRVIINQESIIKTIPTIQQKNKTDISYSTITPTHIPTVPWEIRGLKEQNLGISTGNKGVPTDRQTDRPTDIPTHFFDKKNQKNLELDIKEATEILESLDNIKKEIRLKFKHLTHQEMIVFSTIYQLEDQGFNNITYKTLAKQLNLAESSIRDYILRIVNKGIPIKKKKINNKTIVLFISEDLKKIASLSTINKLREL